MTVAEMSRQAEGEDRGAPAPRPERGRDDSSSMRNRLRRIDGFAAQEAALAAGAETEPHTFASEAAEGAATPVKRRERAGAGPAPEVDAVSKGEADEVRAEAPDASPEAAQRKADAKAWLEAQLSAPVADGSQLVALLDQAKAMFGLTEVMIDTRSEAAPKIGLSASPFVWASYFPNKAVGNTLSDWVLWGFYGTTSEVSRWVRSKKPQDTDETEVTWGPLTGRGFGSYMLADPLTTYGPPGGSPSVSNATWEVLRRRRQKASGASSYYVLGHLLNDNVHGPGDDMKNLTPLSQRTNNHSPVGHLRAVENTVKGNVGAAPLCYQVIPHYGRSPLQWPRYLRHMVNVVSEIGDVLAAEDHVPTGLHCKVWRYDTATGGREVVVDKWVPQMQVSKVDAHDHYFVQTAHGVLDITDPEGVWKALEVVFLAAIGAGMALGAAQVAPLLADCAGGMGMSVAELIAEHQYSVAAVTGMLSAHQSQGMNQFPKDPSLKED